MQMIKPHELRELIHNIMKAAHELGVNFEDVKADKLSDFAANNPDIYLKKVAKFLFDFMAINDLYVQGKEMGHKEASEIAYHNIINMYKIASYLLKPIYDIEMMYRRKESSENEITEVYRELSEALEKVASDEVVQDKEQGLQNTIDVLEENIDLLSHAITDSSNFLGGHLEALKKVIPQDQKYYYFMQFLALIVKYLALLSATSGDAVTFGAAMGMLSEISDELAEGGVEAPPIQNEELLDAIIDEIKNVLSQYAQTAGVDQNNVEQQAMS